MRRSSTLRRVAATAAAVAALAACGTDDDAAAPGTSPDATDTPTTTTTAAPPPELEAVEVQLTPVAELDDPIAMAVRPGDDDTFYVAQRDGTVVTVVDGEVGPPVVDVSDETTTDVERGLLGLAFAPDGAHLYVSYTDAEGDSHLDELAIDDAGEVDTDSQRSVLVVEQPFPNHNGGHLAFGPDGHLYLSFGDGGAAGDPQGNGQDPTSLLGTMMRIEPTPDGDEPYAVPDDNPYVGTDDGAPEVWAHGLRNPWRFSFDRATDDLWIADVGQGEVEEINHVPAGDGAGANFGWNLMEGSQPYDGADGPPADGYVGPVFEYDNDGTRCSVTGGYVYRGAAVPDLVGSYVYGDYCEGEVRALRLGDDGEVTGSGLLGISVEPGTLVSFGEDADGELYVLSFEGTLSRIDAA